MKQRFVSAARRGDLSVLPLGLEQVGMALMVKAAVDLLALQPERAAASLRGALRDQRTLEFGQGPHDVEEQPSARDGVLISSVRLSNPRPVSPTSP